MHAPKKHADDDRVDERIHVELKTVHIMDA
jgi:hypothetical protein